MKLDDAAAGLEALGNPTRLKIYRRWCAPVIPALRWDACRKN